MTLTFICNSRCYRKIRKIQYPRKDMQRRTSSRKIALHREPPFQESIQHRENHALPHNNIQNICTLTRNGKAESTDVIKYPDCSCIFYYVASFDLCPTKNNAVFALSPCLYPILVFPRVPVRATPDIARYSRFHVTISIFGTIHFTGTKFSNCLEIILIFSLKNFPLVANASYKIEHKHWGVEKMWKYCVECAVQKRVHTKHRIDLGKDGLRSVSSPGWELLGLYANGLFLLGPTV